jgi:hypothetical protein
VETGEPNIVVWKATATCASQSVPCHGGEDSVLAKHPNVPAPPVNFGPLPAPVPPAKPTLDCEDTIHVKVHQRLDNLRICSSTGNPLPGLTFNGNLPESVTPTRSAADATKVVLNGTFNQARTYGVIVRGKVASPPWTDEDLVKVVVAP